MSQKKSKMYLGSICFTDLQQAMKAAHSSGTKARNGKVYTSVCIYVNEEPDKFDNHISIQLSSTKEKRDDEGKFYIGNARLFERDSPIKPEDIGDDDDLPF